MALNQSDPTTPTPSNSGPGPTKHARTGFLNSPTVHKHRNLLAHAPDRLHEEVSADYTDMIYAANATEVAERRKAFLRKWRLKCRAVADSLEEAGDKLFTFTRLPPSQWKSARTTNAVERLHEEFKRPDQDPNRPALGGNSRHAVLGSARLGPDYDEKNRRLADVGRETDRSAH